MASLSLHFYHYPQPFSEEVVTRPCLSLKDGPKGSPTYQCATGPPICPSRVAQPWGTSQTCSSLAWGVLPTCPGSSELPQSLRSKTCLSEKVPVSLRGTAVWGNATGSLSQLSCVPAEICAAWETKTGRKSYFNLT